MRPVQITIIGGGFCGIMTAIHLLQYHQTDMDIHIINKDNPLAKGVAYNPHTASLLLNVPNGKISAFDDQPGHFMEWLINDQPQLAGVANLPELFAPRQQYGRYLTHTWAEALRNKPAGATVTTYDDEAQDIIKDGECFHIVLKRHPVLTADFVVLATGNTVPQLPSAFPAAFAGSRRYFANPWKKDTIENLDANTDVLIIGNGLTMVDTVIGLVEKAFNKNIHTISPNGYQLKPSSETKQAYCDSELSTLMKSTPGLLDMVKYVNKHRKIAQHKNLSWFPLIDQLRPYNQQLWQSFSFVEKKRFVKSFLSLWGTVRHRLPVSMHVFMEKMQAEKRLFTHKGRIVSVIETNNKVIVTVNCQGELKTIGAQRVINCTGPAANLKQSGNILLRNISKSGLINTDDLNMGVKANPENGMVINADGSYDPNLFVVGSNLRGALLESTAVPELRTQTEKLAALLVEKCYEKQHLQKIA